jgi:hypothetical protein
VHVRRVDTDTVHRSAVIDEIRRSAFERMRRLAKSRWMASNSLASDGMIELGRAVLNNSAGPGTLSTIAKRSAKPRAKQAHTLSILQGDFVHVATNSVHWHRLVAAADGSMPLTQLQCECTQHLIIEHLASCAQPLASHFRNQLLADIVSHLSSACSRSCAS